MATDTFISTSQGGQLNDKTRQKIKSTLEFWSGKKLIVTISDKEISIKKLYGTRSLNQNKLWWLYMTILADDLGYTSEEMHEICKFKFLKKEKVDEKSGEIFSYVGSTTALTKIEFMELMDNVMKWSAETLNIILPIAGEIIPINFAD